MHKKGANKGPDHLVALQSKFVLLTLCTSEVILPVAHFHSLYFFLPLEQFLLLSYVYLIVTWLG